MPCRLACAMVARVKISASSASTAGIRTRPPASSINPARPANCNRHGENVGHRFRIPGSRSGGKGWPRGSRRKRPRRDACVAFDHTGAGRKAGRRGAPPAARHRAAAASTWLAGVTSGSGRSAIAPRWWRPSMAWIGPGGGVRTPGHAGQPLPASPASRPGPSRRWVARADRKAARRHDRVSSTPQEHAAGHGLVSMRNPQ